MPHLSICSQEITFRESYHGSIMGFRIIQFLCKDNIFWFKHSCTEQYFHHVRTSTFRTSWQARYFGNNWLTACCSIDSVPTPLFFHESWQGPDRAQNSIITYLSVGYNHMQAHWHLPTCSGFSSRKREVYICREFVRMERIVSKKAYICNAEVRKQNTESR